MTIKVNNVQIHGGEISRPENTTKKNKPVVTDDVISRWENILDSCAQIMQIPASLIMKVNKGKTKLVAKNNSTGNPYEGGKSATFEEGLYLKTIITKNEILSIPDVGEFNSDHDMRAYLGMPILWPDKSIFGVICIFDYKENNFDHRFIDLMATFRKTIEADLELLETRKEMQTLEYTDLLTHLFNRRRIDELLFLEFQRALRYATTYSVILFDIDDFKSINDTFGHHIGDQILINIAELINERIRTVDMAGRWEGEEFIIICPETKLGDTAFLAECIRKIIADTLFPVVGHITCSFGVATYRKTDTNPDDALNWADQLLYEVKVTGKNKVLSG